MKPTDWEGFLCPNPDCPAEAENHKVGQNKKGKDVITRKNTCKTCGTTFETVQVVSKSLVIKNDHLKPAPVETPAVTPEVPAVAQTVAPVVPLAM